jgi:hypothetical protein
MKNEKMKGKERKRKKEKNKRGKEKKERRGKKKREDPAEGSSPRVVSFSRSRCLRR